MGKDYRPSRERHPRGSLFIAISITLSLLTTALVSFSTISHMSPGAAASTQSRTVSEEDEWPYFRGDASHSGYTNVTVTDNPSLRWVFEVPRNGYENFSLYQSVGPCGPDVGYFNVGSPVISRGIAIFHAIGWPCAQIRSGTDETVLRLYALNASTGKHLWNWSVESMAYRVPNPIITNDTVVIGEGEHLYGFDIVTGNKKWQIINIDYLYHLSFISFIDGQIYIGDSNSFSYERTTHLSTFSYDGDFLWSINKRAYGMTPPLGTLNEQIIAPVPVTRNETIILKINKESGKIISNYSVNARLDSNSVVVGDYLCGQRMDYQDNLQQVSCFDMENNQVIWSYNISNPYRHHYLGFPSYALDLAMGKNNSVLVVNGIDGIIRGLSPEGEMVWSFTVEEGPYATALSSPSIAGNRVIFGGYNGRIYMLNVTGDEIWSYLPKYPSRSDRHVDERFTVSGRFEVIETSPAIINEWFYIAAKDGKIYAFGPSINDGSDDQIFLSSAGVIAVGISVVVATIAICIIFKKSR